MSDKANDITKITDFVADGKPKGKKKGKWSLATDILRNQVAKEAALHQMSRITNRVRKDPKDQRQHRDIRYVSKVTDNNHGRYIYHDWGEEEANDLFLSYDVSTESYVSMHDYEVIDTAKGRTERELGTRNVMVFDNDTGEFLVGKVSQRQCRECMGKKGDQNRMYKDIAKTLKIKPDIGRGNQHSGLSSAYKIYGFRKDPKGTAVSMYAFLPNSDEKDKTEALQIIGRLCEKMEKAASRIGNYLAESKIYKLIQHNFFTPHSNFWKRGLTVSDYKRKLRETHEKASRKVRKKKQRETPKPLCGKTSKQQYQGRQWRLPPIQEKVKHHKGIQKRFRNISARREEKKEKPWSQIKRERASR